MVECRRVVFFFFKQKTAYEIYQCDWSSDVCSSDLAVQLYAEAQRKPDLVLLDLNMPITGGEETFHRLRQVDAQAPVLFVSGYWDRELERRLRAQGALGFVQKPYEVRQLKEALHAAIIEKSVSG